MKNMFRKTLSVLAAALFFSTALAGCDFSLGGSGGTGGGSGSGGHAHTDGDGDAVCDTCGDSVLVPLTFLAVNDLHGKFVDTASQPGVDEFTTYLKDLYEDQSREEILLSSGDMWQGTAESASNKGKLMTEWMNDVGFVSMTLGNHEYDWGADVLTPNSELAEFPFLGINVTYNGRMPDYCKPSVVVERGGMKIGIIGAIGNCLSSISGEFTSGLKFATGGLLTAQVQAEARRLRNEEGCGFIVYSIHDGGEFPSSGTTNVKNSDLSYYDTALSAGYAARNGYEGADHYVDLVFEGHTHQPYIIQDEYGVYHMQGGGENKSISTANVTFNTVTKKYTVVPRLVSSGVYGSSSIEDDAIVEILFDKYCGGNDPYNTIGYNARKRDSSTLLSQVAKLYYEKGTEEWKDYKIACGGGYLNARSPYNLSAGDVSYADLYSILPFDNDIVLGKIKGSDFVTFLQKQNPSGSSGSSKKYTIYTTVNEKEVVSSEDYYIIVDSYTSSYSFNNITEIARIKGVYARDLLAEYIAAGEWAR